MSGLERLNIGIAGACGRGAGFKTACDAAGIQILAVCDINADALHQAAENLGAKEEYTDYSEMLEKSDLDAVIVGTPMQFHVPMAIEALRKNLHVLSEVTAGVNTEECRALVQECKRSKGIYMMAENYTYMKPNVMVREMVRRGVFGDVYYAEGEYIHELKGLSEITKWRRHWQQGIEGNTYCTHSLGPILQWMEGDRVVRICCEGTGSHHVDPRGVPYASESSTMLCKTRKGALIKIRVDMLSDRPHSMTNYQLQGVDGAYESARAEGEINRIWLKGHSKEEHVWENLTDLEAEFLPESWREATEAAKTAGHGGGDYFEIMDFLDAVTGKRPCEIGIHEAMDMTLPGLVSQQSILEGARWMEVPDSREW